MGAFDDIPRSRFSDIPLATTEKEKTISDAIKNAIFQAGAGPATPLVSSFFEADTPEQRRTKAFGGAAVRSGTLGLVDPLKDFKARGTQEQIGEALGEVAGFGLPFAHPRLPLVKFSYLLLVLEKG